MISRLRLFWFQFKATLRFLITGSCGLNCGYEAPYGFVPEADCPIHDLPAAPFEHAAITVWADGTWVVWRASDAIHAHTDADHIASISLNRIMADARQGGTQAYAN